MSDSLSIARALSESSLIPRAFQSRPGDVLIALDISKRLGLSPFEVLNGITIINGKPTFNAQFSIALANSRGPFMDRISYDVEGSGIGISVTAKATLKDGSLASATVSMEMAHGEGWTKNPKYKSMPEHMLKLRAATFLIRTTCPEILLGMHSTEEIADVLAAKKTGQKIESLNAKIAK